MVYYKKIFIRETIVLRKYETCKYTKVVLLHVYMLKSAYFRIYIGRMPGIAEQKAACCRRTALLDGSAIAGRINYILYEVIHHV